MKINRTDRNDIDDLKVLSSWKGIFLTRRGEHVAFYQGPHQEDYTFAFPKKDFTMTFNSYPMGNFNTQKVERVLDQFVHQIVGRYLLSEDHTYLPSDFIKVQEDGTAQITFHSDYGNGNLIITRTNKKATIAFQGNDMHTFGNNFNILTSSKDYAGYVEEFGKLFYKLMSISNHLVEEKKITSCDPRFFVQVEENGAGFQKDGHGLAFFQPYRGSDLIFHMKGYDDTIVIEKNGDTAEARTYELLEETIYSLFAGTVLEGKETFSRLPQDFINLKEKKITWHSVATNHSTMELLYSPSDIQIHISSLKEENVVGFTNVIVGFGGSRYQHHYRSFTRLLENLQNTFSTSEKGKTYHK